MYIVNGICYAGKLVEGIKVTAAQPLIGGMMLVTFSTGERRLSDTTLLKGPVYEPLANDEIFRKPVMQDGITTWDNGKIDIAPETVYRESYSYETEEN